MLDVSVNLDFVDVLVFLLWVRVSWSNLYINIFIKYYLVDWFLFVSLLRSYLIIKTKSYVIYNYQQSDKKNREYQFRCIYGSLSFY